MSAQADDVVESTALERQEAWHERGGRRSLARHALPWLGVAVALGIWQLVVASNVVSNTILSPPGPTAGALLALIGSGRTWVALVDTVVASALGFAVAVVLGVPLGVLLGVSKAAYRVSVGLVEFMKPVPPITILPLVLLIYGTRLQMSVVLVAFGAFWPILINTSAGVRAVEPMRRATAKAFRVGPFRTLFWVLVPGASVFVATGLRVAGTVSLLVAITAELVGGAPGLGNLLTVAQTSGDYPRIYALVVLCGALGIVVNLLLVRLQRLALGWNR